MTATSTLDTINATLAELATTYAALLDTRAVFLGLGASGASGLEVFCRELPEATPQTPWLLAADANTWAAAGQALASAMDAAGLSWKRYDVPTPPHHEAPMCDDDAVAAFEVALGEGTYAAAIAVGSGTINDIVKLAAHRAGVPMAVLCTAPSMNGYTSKIAAVLSEGVKTTVPCTAPCVVVADLDVMAEAPYRMIASGLGDLISKPVSNADWMLSALLNDTFHSAEAMAVIERGAAMLEGVAPRLPSRDREAMAGLVGSLMFSGLAMSIAGSSSPASGGEHLISHHIDMTAHAYDQPYDFHGCQVGVGTLTTAGMYERLRAMDPATIDVEALVAAHPAWETHDAALRERFGKLYPAVVQHARAAYPDAETLRARLSRLTARWDEIMAAVGVTLRTRASLEAELRTADAPVRFAELGITRQRAHDAIAHSKDIRNRYTILHLAAELGTLDAWTAEALEALWD